MALPTPPHALDQHCSTIWNNTLYVYTPTAFQSLSLSAGAEWQQEAMGVSLNGATCNQGWVEGDSSRPALFIVGGATNSSSVIYPGLQRYSFLEKKWDTIVPAVKVTENRKYHGSAFLNASSSLVVYAGSQDGIDGPSSQTFVISTVAPYPVLAYESSAPPVTSPVMLPWNDTAAVMVGGDSSNTAVYTFSPDGGWQNSGVTLASGIPDHTQASCGLLTLNDGSKVLETFDLSKSPNTVSRVVLLDANGVPAPVGQTVGDGSSGSSRKSRRRDLTLNNFPTYNNSLAPTETRSGASLAQGSDGLIVISGGNDKHPLCIFNPTQNSWVNATKLLDTSTAQSIIAAGGATSTASSTASATGVSSSPSSTSSSSSSSSSSSGGSNHSLVILGAVLGAVFGLAALCIIALLVLRYLKKQTAKRTSGGDSPAQYPPDQKVRRRSTSFSFHDPDQSLQPFSKAGVPMARGPVPSTDSAAFFKELGGGSKFLPLSNNANTFSTSVVGGRKPSISRPIPLDEKPRSGAADASRDNTAHRKTDEGWSTYFQGNNAINLAEGRNTFDSQLSPTDYRESTWPDFTAPPSPGEALVRKGNVSIGSPTLSHPASNGRGTGLAVSDGMSGQISRAESMSSRGSMDDPLDYDKLADVYSNTAQDSTAADEGWSAVNNSRNGRRPPSSTYTQSYYPGLSVYGDRPESNLSAMPPPLTQRLTRWPAEDQAQAGQGAPIANTQLKPQRPPRPSQATMQMRDVYGTNNGTGRSLTPSDMSWLNLGNQANQANQANQNHNNT